jgi:hypothetical protein
MRFLKIVALVAGLFAPAAFAQTGAPACKGVIVMVRLSEITPGGSAGKFKAAIAAQQAWYKSHGFKNNQIVLGEIAEQDSATRMWSDSTTRFYTFHINPPDPSTLKPDAGWDAFGKMFADTSKIVETHFVCMPETVVSTDPVPWMKM